MLTTRDSDMAILTPTSYGELRDQLFSCSFSSTRALQQSIRHDILVDHRRMDLARSAMLCAKTGDVRHVRLRPGVMRRTNHGSLSGGHSQADGHVLIRPQQSTGAYEPFQRVRRVAQRGS